MAGKMVHLEIPAQDSAAAREFWGSLFGWEFQAYDDSTDYQMARIDDESGVAISGMDPDLRGPRVVFDVDDIQAGAARVRELGGEASEKAPVPGMGWFSNCKDPQGNDFGLWQTDPSAQMPGE